MKKNERKLISQLSEQKLGKKRERYENKSESHNYGQKEVNIT